MPRFIWTCVPGPPDAHRDRIQTAAIDGFWGGVVELVLLEGIELSTSPLPRECSTTELQQRRVTGGAVS
jgi:hypothetical protein